jgi:penicillin-binding protein 1A
MFRITKILISLFLSGVFLAVIGLISLYYFLAPKLPEISELKQTPLQVPLRIFSAENLLIAEYGDKRRIPIEYSDVPTQLVHAFLASEDDRFFEHPGVDYQGLLRAAYSLATTGQKAQGGSTITMQVARNFYLSNEKTYLRKLNEIILSLQIEQSLTKEEILTLYLNKIYLGNRAYGIAAASIVYYGRPLNELTLAEYAMIAGLPKAPSRYNPLANPERALIRRNYVLRRMWEVGFITEQAFLTASQDPITSSYHSREVEVYAPFVAEMVRTQLIDMYGEDAYKMGLNVYTTIQGKQQRAANYALQKALLDYDHRHGYRGPLKQVAIQEPNDLDYINDVLADFETVGPLVPSIVTETNSDSAILQLKERGAITLSIDDLAWARKKLSTNSRGKKPSTTTDVFTVGDIVYLYQNQDKAWQLAQIPEAEAALVAVSPYDGSVTALNGGFEYFQNKFNRATQSRRQPGSGFKPFLYSAALEKGYTPATIINDAPVVFDDPGLENVWRPENYSGKFYGPTTLRKALINSRNLVSIRLIRDISPSYTADYASQFGFESNQMPRNLSLALGSGNAAPWDMARAYSAFANGGYRIEPYVIHHIENANSEIIYQAQPLTVCETCSLQATDVDYNTDEYTQFHPAKRIMTPQNNYIMNSLLRDVVKYGTGRKALSLGRDDLAGKTGTTNDQVDAWFNGFHPELVAIAWVGFDSPRTLGRYETGGRAALPMWIDFMKVALEDVPDEPLILPVDMVTVQIDPQTGLLAGPHTQGAIYESFRNENVPTMMSPEINHDEIDSDTQTSTPIIDLF